MDRFPLPPPRPTQAGTQRTYNERMARVEDKLMQTLELIADKYVTQYSAPPEAPADVRRRAMANALQMWRRCPQKTCLRTRACRGEPAHCLDACFPGLPPGFVAAHVASTRRRPRR